MTKVASALEGFMIANKHWNIQRDPLVVVVPPIDHFYN